MKTVNVKVTIQLDLSDRYSSLEREALKQGYTWEDDGHLWKGEDQQSLDSFNPSIQEAVTNEIDAINLALSQVSKYHGLKSNPQILSAGIDDDDIEIVEPSE